MTARVDVKPLKTLWTRTARGRLTTPEISSAALEPGLVHLMKHGSRSEYKIGRTYSPLRRHGEVRIELPEKLAPVRFIETDDPAGVETYWHNRFAAKRSKVNGLRVEKGVTLIYGTHTVFFATQSKRKSKRGSP